MRCCNGSSDSGISPTWSTSAYLRLPTDRRSYRTRIGSGCLPSSVNCRSSILARPPLRRRCAPQVIAYWLGSARIAAAAYVKTWGAPKLGKPWAGLIASYSLARLVIARMTDSVKPSVRSAVLIGRLSGYWAEVLSLPQPLQVLARSTRVQCLTRYAES
jgi:hypothetical protein